MMMAVESMVSKRPVLKIAVALLLLLKLFSPHIYCIPTFDTIGFDKDCKKRLSRFLRALGIGISGLHAA